MTALVTIAPLEDADVRWQAWRARGREDDRRMTKRLRGWMILLVVGLIALFVVQLS